MADFIKTPMMSEMRKEKFMKPMNVQFLRSQIL